MAVETRSEQKFNIWESNSQENDYTVHESTLYFARMVDYLQYLVNRFGPGEGLWVTIKSKCLLFS